MSDTKRWRLVVEYGPERIEVGAVEFAAPVSEDVADAFALALLRAWSEYRREHGLEYDVSIRMSTSALPE